MKALEGIECDRLSFIIERDGPEASILFAKQGMMSYRVTVLKCKGHVHKQGLIMRYLHFKKFYLENIK